jgi:hypothetical protein
MKLPSFFPESDRVWALRYIREAIVDLYLAQELNNPETVMELALIAIRKARLAVKYALSQPEYPEIIADQQSLKGLSLEEASARILIKMREVAQSLSEQEHPPKKETVVETTRIIVNAAESVVETLQ